MCICWLPCIMWHLSVIGIGLHTVYVSHTWPDCTDSTAGLSADICLGSSIQQCPPVMGADIGDQT